MTEIDANRIVSCPNCGCKIAVSLGGFKARSETVPDAVERAIEPEPSKLQTAALEEMVEAGLEGSLRRAACRIKSNRMIKDKRKSGMPDLSPDRIFLASKCFTCSNCSSFLNVLIDYAIVSAVLAIDNERTPLRKVDNDLKEFITTCAEAGLITAFEQAVCEQIRLKQLEGEHGPPLPVDMHKYFAVFLKQAARAFPKSLIFDHLRADFPGNNLQYWQCNGVGLVTLDDAIYRFYPACVFDRKKAASNLQRTLLNPARRLEESKTVWVKSRYGYVPAGNQMFLGQLRQKSQGAFANLGN